MQDVTGTTTYSYDRLSRLTTAAQPNGTITYGYDRDSNRTSVLYPGTGGGTVNYAYSNGGRLSSLTDWASRSTTYTYLASGLADMVSVPGGMTIDYGYDRAQRLTSLTNMVGATPITTHTYTLDAEGNRTQLVEFLSGVTPSGQTETFGYSYDGLNRLTAVTTTNAEGFTLDGASNITARTGPSATYTIDGENRPTSDGTHTLTWSNADRLTGRGADTFGYDALDRLTSSTVAGTSRTYAYNGDGLLQSRTQGSTTSFVWDLGTSPSRLLAQGGDRIIYGLGPLYVVKSDGTTRALARDGGKSVRAEVDGTGALTASWRYRAYGEMNQFSGQSTPSVLGHAGQLLDPSGLHYMRARWYDAASGRFITRDPLLGSPETPSTLNSYAYAASNPVYFADPTGASVSVGANVECACFGEDDQASDGASWARGSASTKDGMVFSCGIDLNCHTVLAGDAQSTPLINPGQAARGINGASYAVPTPGSGPGAPGAPSGAADRMPFADAARRERVALALADADAGIRRHLKDLTPYRNENAALPAGNYLEYTVSPTNPRGLERLVVDGKIVYYTAEHYAKGSFVRIR